MRIQRGGGQGVRTPPGKSQVIWVSIGNKQLDPPGKWWTPSGTLKNDGFLWNWPFDFCKISWGLKKKKKKKKDCQSFICQTDLDPPPPDEISWIRAWNSCGQVLKSSQICILLTFIWFFKGAGDTRVQNLGVSVRIHLHHELKHNYENLIC